MSTVAVVDAAASASPAGDGGELSVRPTLGPHTGFARLEQAVIDCPVGAAGAIGAGEAERTLFCLSGRGEVELDGAHHPLEPDVGVVLPPGSTCTIRTDGPAPLRLISVAIPDPEPGPAVAPAVSRVSEQALGSATTQRAFRIVADPRSGLRSATHFVGYVPPVRAPDHFHLYDEVIYVLEGEGRFHAGDLCEPIFPGACIQLPAGTVHCLENTGGDDMRLVAVFRPAGSPAAAFYPDGTPADQGSDEDHSPEEDST